MRSTLSPGLCALLMACAGMRSPPARPLTSLDRLLQILHFHNVIYI
jgi:hypothetical protein